MSWILINLWFDTWPEPNSWSLFTGDNSSWYFQPDNSWQDKSLFHQNRRGPGTRVQEEPAAVGLLLVHTHHWVKAVTSIPGPHLWLGDVSGSQTGQSPPQQQLFVFSVTFPGRIRTRAFSGPSPLVPEYQGETRPFHQSAGGSAQGSSSVGRKVEEKS